MPIEEAHDIEDLAKQIPLRKRSEVAYIALFSGLAMFLFGIIGFSLRLLGEDDCFIGWGVLPLVIGFCMMILAYRENQFKKADNSQG